MDFYTEPQEGVVSQVPGGLQIQACCHPVVLVLDGSPKQSARMDGVVQVDDPLLPAVAFAIWNGHVLQSDAPYFF